MGGEYQATYIQNVLNVCSQPCNFSPKYVQSCCHTFFSSFSWFSHFWCPVCHPNVLFCNYKKVFAFWMLQLFYPPIGARWGSLVKMPQSNNWPLYQFLYDVIGSLQRPRLPSGFLTLSFIWFRRFCYEVIDQWRSQFVGCLSEQPYSRPTCTRD